MSVNNSEPGAGAVEFQGLDLMSKPQFWGYLNFISAFTLGGNVCSPTVLKGGKFLITGKRFECWAVILMSIIIVFLLMKWPQFYFLIPYSEYFRCFPELILKYWAGQKVRSDFPCQSRTNFLANPIVLWWPLCTKICVCISEDFLSTHSQIWNY